MTAVWLLVRATVTVGALAHVLLTSGRGRSQAARIRPAFILRRD